MVLAIRTIAQTLQFVSPVVLILTVASLPWMLGGVVPLARLTLLIGSILAATLSLLAGLMNGRAPRSLTVIMIPIVAMAALGIFQLRASDHYLSADMHHAVNDSVWAGDGDTSYAHSIIPADTRNNVAMLLSLALVAVTAFETLRSREWVIGAGLLLVANGVLVTVLGLSDVFGNQQLSLNDNWSFGRTADDVAFAAFVNPNSAAGWLCLVIAIAAGWVSWYLRPTGVDNGLNRGRLKIPWVARVWRRFVEGVADLTAWQASVFCAIVMLTVGVASTQSRGGIIALVAGVVLTAVARSSLRQLPAVILLLTAGAAATFGLLRSFDLDSGVLSELESLKDLKSAAAVRVNHWQDSLHAVQDFPITGTGLGSYRFATLPYLTQYSKLWFRNADNHYVDMIVEGGVLGLGLFLAVGVCGVLAGLAAWRRSDAKLPIPTIPDQPRVSRRFLAGLGTAAILATLTQACAAFFDYGIAMPAASSLFVVIVAAVTGYLSEVDDRLSVVRTGSVSVGSRVVVAVQVVVIVAAACLVSDQVAATRIDTAVVTGHQILYPPVTNTNLERIDPARQRLADLLEQRPDDPEALRVLSRLAEAQLRRDILRDAAGTEVEDGPSLNKLWSQLSFHGILKTLSELERTAPATASQLRQNLQAMVEKTEVLPLLNSIQQQYPLMPRVGEERATVAVVAGDTETFDQLCEIIPTVEPGNAGALFRLGVLAIHSDRREQAKNLWHQSIALSEDFRPSMLAQGSGYWQQSELLSLFGPTDYSTCVQTALGTENKSLKQLLWDQAEDFFSELEQPVSESVAMVRVQHLTGCEQDDDAIVWLESILETHDQSVDLRVKYAKLLEKTRAYHKAKGVWDYVHILDPGNSEADAGLVRISDLQTAPVETLPIQ